MDIAPLKPVYEVRTSPKDGRNRADAGATVQKYFHLWIAAEADRKVAVSNEITSRAELDKARANIHANSGMIASLHRDAAVIRESRHRERAVLRATRDTHEELAVQWWFAFLPRYFRDAIRGHIIQANQVL